VDGRNPAPVDRWLIPLFIGFQTSKVVQDFFHPQYDDGYIMLYLLQVMDLSMVQGPTPRHLTKDAAGMGRSSHWASRARTCDERR